MTALKVIGQLASDKVSNLGKQIEAARLARIVENAPISLMYTNRDLIIKYMNPASIKLMKRLEPYLPCKAEELIGRSISIFHKDPDEQRKPLTDPKLLPHQELIEVGPEVVDATASALLDASGNFLGPMIAWDIVTEKLANEAREAELAADTSALNQVLLAMGKATSFEEVITTALTTVREAFGWNYGSHWCAKPTRAR